MDRETSLCLPYLIKKRLQLEEELYLRKQFIRSLWHFYSVYNFALVITGIEDKKINKKNRLFKSLLNNLNKDSLKKINKLRESRHEEFDVINKAIQILESKQEMGSVKGDNYQFLGCCGVSTFYE